MRQFNRFRGTKGFLSTWNRAVRFRYMITEAAKNRTKILAFWKKHGAEAAEEAQGRKREVGGSQSGEPYTENKTQTSVGLPDTGRAPASARRTSKPW